MANIFRPPLATRIWQRDPAGVALRSGEIWTNRLLNLLASKDKFFGAPGQPPANLDWPVPRGKPYPQDLRTWTQEPTVPGTPPLAQRDWPVPRGPIPSISLRTWIGGRLIIPEGTPFAQLEWPVPKGRPFPVDLRTWLVNLQEGTFSLPQKPFSMLDWPVTRLRPRSTSLLTWIGGRIITSDVLPPVFQEQALPPRGPSRNISLLTWVGGRLIIEEIVPPTPTPVVIERPGGDSRRVGLRKRPLYFWEAAALKRLSAREVEDSLVEELAYAEATIPKSLDDFEERVSHLREIAKRLDAIRVYHELAKRVRSVIERFEETRIKQLADQDEENEINDLIQFL